MERIGRFEIAFIICSGRSWKSISESPLPIDVTKIEYYKDTHEKKTKIDCRLRLIDTVYLIALKVLLLWLIILFICFSMPLKY